MLRKLIRISLQLAGIFFLVFAGLLIYSTLGIAVERNSLSMLNGPLWSNQKLFGLNSRIDSILHWTYKAPLVIALPKHVENCSASKLIQSAAHLELITVDSLCNITPHQSNATFVVPCRHPLNDDKNVCFASAYIGNLSASWVRKSFEEGSISINRSASLNNVTPFLALDSRINQWATSEAWGRELNGAFKESPQALQNYVKQSNEKLQSSNFDQRDVYSLSASFVWKYSGERWEQTGDILDFQEKYQTLLQIQ
jgi:hypothetical protein